MKSILLKIYVFCSILILLFVSKLLIFFIPFKRLVSLMEHKSVLKSKKKKEFSSKLVSFVRKSLMLVSKKSPITFNCFAQALSAKVFFNFHKIQSTVTFGMRRDEAEDKLKAHAWLEIGSLTISGGDTKHLHTKLYSIT